MQAQSYRLDRKTEYKKATPFDLIQLLPAPNGNVLFLPRIVLETMVLGVVRTELLHLSGPTGSAKTSFLEAMGREPRNFTLVCELLGLPPEAPSGCSRFRWRSSRRPGSSITGERSRMVAPSTSPAP